MTAEPQTVETDDEVPGAPEPDVAGLITRIEELGGVVQDPDDIDGLEALLARLEAPRPIDVRDHPNVPLVTAVAYAMAEAGQVTKSSLNTDQGYKFASAEAILGAVRRPLLERGVVLSMHPSGYEVETFESRRGSKGTRIVADLDFVFRDGHGGELRIEGWRGVGEDYGDKAIGKAYTNAVKTFVRSQWLLPTEHDDPEKDQDKSQEPAELPLWAQPATDARKREMRDALVPFFGADVVTRVGRAFAAPENYGLIPDGFVAFAKALAATKAALDDAARAASAAEQDAAAEAPDAPAPEPEPDVPPGDEPGPEDVPPEEGDPVDRPGPASIDPPDLTGVPVTDIEALRATGCSCSSPLEAAKPDRPMGTADDSCPIRGHGIPF